MGERLWRAVKSVYEYRRYKISEECGGTVAPSPAYVGHTNCRGGNGCESAAWASFEILARDDVLSDATAKTTPAARSVGPR